MTEPSQNFAEQGAAFQKLWVESMSKLMQAAFTFSPNSTPPELVREIRDSILQALGETWNEFLRSPQFQENMRQWMENAVAFRAMSNDFLGRVRREMQAPAREDIDAVLLNLRHLETRILDRLETLSTQVEALRQQPPAGTASAAAAPAAPAAHGHARARANPRGARNRNHNPPKAS
jgi:hypothetical protein